MRLSITRGQRSLLLFLSASGYIAWFAGVGARLEAAGVVGPQVTSMIVPQAPPIPRVANAIVRDPFAGAPQTGAGQAPPPSVDLPAAALGGAPSAKTDATVPNIAGGAADTTVADASAAQLAVRATIVGRNSVAYVANGTEMDIVRVGDSLGDRRVAAIDLDGIAFTDGSRLDLSGGYTATPKPVDRGTRMLQIPLDELRTLFAAHAAQTASTAPPATLASSPSPSDASPAIVTPGPLRTADSRGLAPGVTPTPNTVDPTAAPYPYPYPAARP
jgi:hypothetical protein